MVYKSHHLINPGGVFTAGCGHLLNVNTLLSSRDDGNDFSAARTHPDLNESNEKQTRAANRF
jgi:hypothetical protein